MLGTALPSVSPRQLKPLSRAARPSTVIVPRSVQTVAYVSLDASPKGSSKPHTASRVRDEVYVASAIHFLLNIGGDDQTADESLNSDEEKEPN